MRAVFDLDGTLIDSAPDILAAGNAVLAGEGLNPISAAQSRSFIGNGARVYVERLERAAAGANDAARTARMQAHFLHEYEVAHALTRPYPGVEPALQALRSAGWRLGLCTNKPLGPARAVLAYFGWSDLFETVIGGDSLPVIKPDPAPLHAALAVLGAGPAVFVGDSEVDAATASAAAIPFALFTEGYRRSPPEAIAHARAFDDFAVLPDLLRAMIDA
ncbi:MAG: phosphoglycolate phosphatase [Pararhodobacter sp.]